MNRNMLRLTLASVFIAASQVITMSPANAAVVGLECHRDNGPGFLYYWIDLENKTITSAATDTTGVNANSIETRPVTITPEAFGFNTGMGQVTINRMSGLNSWPGQLPLMCTATTQAMPAGKF